MKLTAHVQTAAVLSPMTLTLVWGRSARWLAAREARLWRTWRRRSARPIANYKSWYLIQGNKQNCQFCSAKTSTYSWSPDSWDSNSNQGIFTLDWTGKGRFAPIANERAVSSRDKLGKIPLTIRYPTQLSIIRPNCQFVAPSTFLSSCAKQSQKKLLHKKNIALTCVHSNSGWLVSLFLTNFCSQNEIQSSSWTGFYSSRSAPTKRFVQNLWTTKLLSCSAADAFQIHRYFTLFTTAAYFVSQNFIAHWQFIQEQIYFTILNICKHHVTSELYTLLPLIWCE